MKKRFIVAITGASGVSYAVRLVQALVEAKYDIELVISDAARHVIQEELNITPKSLTQTDSLVDIFGPEIKSSVKAYSYKDFTAPIASGSFPVEGMVIVPCTVGTLGSIASGVCQNLIHRAADCVMKENRKLILVPRETPLNAIHLENMLKLSRIGVQIVPAMPGFYSGAKDISELIDFMVGKILDQMNVPHVLYPRWVGKQPKTDFSRTTL